MFRLLALVLLLPCAAPAQEAMDFPTAGKVFVLTAIDGAPFTARATLAFPAPGQVAGQAPCNRWTARLAQAFPVFRPQGIAVTRMACDDLAAEAAFLAALDTMRIVRLREGGLSLASPDNHWMDFTLETAP